MSLGLRFYLITATLLIFSIGLKNKVEPKALEVTALRPSLDMQVATVDQSKPAALGFDNFTAALIWIRLIQIATTEMVLSGKVSWEFTQLRQILLLDPAFQPPYEYGASLLSVFRQDRLGAKYVLERWVQKRPLLWRAHYKLGFHLYSELDEYEAAAREILKAAALERAPGWLTSLSIRLLSENGSLVYGLNQAIELYPSVASTEGKARLLLRVRSLRYALEKADWEKRVREFESQQKRKPRSLFEVAQKFPPERRAPASKLENGDPLPEELARALAEPLEFRYDFHDQTIRLADPDKEQLWKSVGIRRPKT